MRQLEIDDLPELVKEARWLVEQGIYSLYVGKNYPYVILAHGDDCCHKEPTRYWFLNTAGKAIAEGIGCPPSEELVEPVVNYKALRAASTRLITSDSSS